MKLTNAALERTAVLLQHWGLTPGENPYAGLLEALNAEPSRARVWEALVTLQVRVPESDLVIHTARSVVLNGAESALAAVGDSPVKTTMWSGALPIDVVTMYGETSPVEVVRDKILVDVYNTTQTDLTSGIQRVTRETVRRWLSDPRVIPVGWDDVHRSFRHLSEAELDGLKHSGCVPPKPAGITQHRYIVPLGGRLILAELAADVWRTPLVTSLAQHSPIKVSAIGYDLIPIFSPETTGPGMPAAFAGYLDSLSWAHRIAPISQGAANEYRAWRQMLAETGKTGPDIRAITLAASPIEAEDGAPLVTEPDNPDELSKDERKALAEARQVAATLTSDPTPLVLVVGSHEPRKNHLAILQASRQLWRAGLKFRLLLIGGGAWKTDDFERAVTLLKDDGHPVSVVRRGSDALIAAAYKVAKFTVFPSFNEGFGLPVAESLAAGTPAITSNFGSMREIGEEHGGVEFIDPRDDTSIEVAMRRLLTDPARLAELREQAEATTLKSWDTYAAETLEYLAG